MANTNSIDFEADSTQYLDDDDNFWKPTNFTIEMWFKPEVDYQNRFLYAGSSDSLSYVISGSVQQVTIRTGVGTTETKTSSTGIVAGTWNHLAFSYKSDQSYAFYLNGQPDGSGSFTSALSWDLSDSLGQGVGGRADGVAPTDGKMDEFRAWADVRTAAEISANYKTDAPAGDNIYIMLHLDNNANDSSGNGYNFTERGSPSYSTDIPDWSDVLGIYTLI